MIIPYKLDQLISPSVVSITRNDWTNSSGDAVADVAADDGDTSYISSSTADDITEFIFSNSATIDTANSDVVGIEVFAVARSFEPNVNLFLYSEKLDESIWAKTNLTISADAIAAPDNSDVHADAVINGASPGNRSIAQTWNHQGTGITMRAYAKLGDDVSAERFRMADGLNQVIFDLTLGTVVTETQVGSGSISDEGGGWYLCEMAVTLAAASRQAVFWFTDGANGQIGDGATITGYLYGMQVYDSSGVPAGYIETEGSPSSTGVSDLSIVMGCDEERKGQEFRKFPRYSSFKVTGGYAKYSVFLSNRPFMDPMGPSGSWITDGTENRVDIVTMQGSTVVFSGIGVRNDTGNGLNVTQLGVNVYTRKRTSLDELSSGKELQTVSILEIEGIRWTPTDMPMSPSAADWSVDSFYCGHDRLLCPGTMKTPGTRRSGSVDRAKGTIEFGGLSVELIDVDRVAWERDSNGDPDYQIYTQGFFSWLFAYGDRSNRNVSSLTNTVSLGWNNVPGLQPRPYNNSATAGHKFQVSDATGFTAGNTADSYVYIDRETVYYNDLATSNFENLQRGVFGSPNGLHEQNKNTGVFPEVTDHPTSWAGRWARLWTVPLDPETGWPLPIDKATARLFVISDITQKIGRGDNVFVLSMAPGESLFDRTIAPKKEADLEAIHFGSKPSTFSIDRQDASLQTWGGTVSGAHKNNDSVLGHIMDRIISDGDKLVIYPFDGVVSVFYNGRGSTIMTCISAPDDTTFDLTMDAPLAVITGFGDDAVSRLKADNHEAATVNGSTNRRIWTAKGLPCDTYVNEKALQLYHSPADHFAVGVADEIVSEHGALFLPDKSKFSIDFVVSKAGKDLKDAIFFSSNGTASVNDAVGDYYDVGPRFALHSTRRGVDTKPVFSKGGESRPKIRTAVLVEEAEPWAILLALMTSTGFYGNNPPSSKGTEDATDVLPRGFGIGLRQELINLKSFRAYSRRGQAWGTRTYSIFEPEKFSKIIAEEMSLPGASILTQDQYGRFSISLRGIPSGTLSAAVPAILDEHLKSGSPIAVKHSRSRIVNKIILNLDYDPIQKDFRTTLEAVEPNSVAIYGEQTLEIEHRGLKSTAFGQNSSTTDSPHSRFVSLATAMFHRNAFEIPEISCTLAHRGLSLIPGQSVALTIADIGDISNSLATGLTSKSAEVVSVDADMVSGEAQVKVVYDRLDLNTGGYAPAGIISAYSSGVVTLEKNEFSLGFPNQLNREINLDDRDYFREVGHTVRIHNVDNATGNHFNTEVTAVHSNGSFTVDTTGIGAFVPAVGDVVIYQPWGSLTPTQATEKFAATANAAGDVTADQPGFKYTT